MKKITPNLMVDDVNKTIAFYKEILGFETIMTVPGHGVFAWALVKNDVVELMFQSRASFISDFPATSKLPVGSTLTLYIDVPDINALYEQIKSNVTIVKDLHNTAYGTQEFAINDCNGYILAFAQTVV